MTLDNIQFLGWVVAAAIAGAWIIIAIKAHKKRK